MVVSGFILGLLGSLHCIGMCGPIAFLLPVDRDRPLKRLLQLMSYHTGRLVTYILLGFIIGLLGKGFSLFGVQQYISIGIGTLMVLAVFFPSKIVHQYHFFKPIYQLLSKIKSALGAELKKKDPETFFTVGFLNGFLPCGLVYMAIFGAIALGDLLQGVLYMILFGLGTIPLMTVTVYMGNFLSGKIKQQLLKVIPVVVIIVGVLFILRGLGLGIPYISPDIMVTQPEVTTLHSCH